MFGVMVDLSDQTTGSLTTSLHISPLPSLFSSSKKVMLPTGAAFRWFQWDCDPPPPPATPKPTPPSTCTQSSAIKCNANSRLDCLGHGHWPKNHTDDKRNSEKWNSSEKSSKKEILTKKKQSTKIINRVMDAPTYSLNQKFKRKEKKNLWQLSFPFLCSILVPFCPFSSRFFLSLKHGTVHCQTEMMDWVWTIN